MHRTSGSPFSSSALPLLLRALTITALDAEAGYRRAAAAAESPVLAALLGRIARVRGGAAADLQRLAFLHGAVSADDDVIVPEWSWRDVRATAGDDLALVQDCVSAEVAAREAYVEAVDRFAWGGMPEDVEETVGTQVEQIVAAIRALAEHPGL